MNTEITLLKWPGEEDWMFAKSCANAEELLTVAGKRLCRKADETTRRVVKLMCCLVADRCPEFRGLMAPPCAFMGECPEMEPCKEGQG